MFFGQIKIPKGVGRSYADVKRKIKVPEEMNNKLSEETGIHIGDGHIYTKKDKQGFSNCQYGISGDLLNEKIYHEQHIKPLLKKIYGIDVRKTE